MPEPRRLATPSRSEDASVVLLLPAAVLVLLVLGAIAVDLALVQGGQRRLVDLAGSVATDAVGHVDVEGAFAGTAHVDLAAAQRHADRSAATLVATDARLRSASCLVAVADGGVRVTCRGTVDPVVGRGLPGNRAREVTATDHARPAG
ncbi:hypothetical protein [Nitriliruptor alkaliphilus]|uniref:hypothetical protein n=1 Tax=Nitriliruptor alkaliphilus TaxID=427918 RepID=UPI0006964D46|nr:hypothetical protein [Nitriliruptor alkaliphilus]